METYTLKYDANLKQICLNIYKNLDYLQTLADDNLIKDLSQEFKSGQIFFIQKELIKN